MMEEVQFSIIDYIGMQALRARELPRGINFLSQARILRILSSHIQSTLALLAVIITLFVYKLKTCMVGAISVRQPPFMHLALPLLMGLLTMNLL